MLMKYLTNCFLTVFLVFSGVASADYKLIMNGKVVVLKEQSGVSKEEVMSLVPSAWYTSEDVVKDTSGNVSVLHDVTGNGYDASKYYGDIKFIENGLNGFPILESFGDSMYSSLNTMDAEGMTVFNVISGDVIGFSNYTYVPSAGFMVYRRNVHGRPDGGNYVRTQEQSTNSFAISTAVVQDGSMSHYVNDTKVSSIGIGNFRVGVSGVIILGRPYLNTNANNTLSNGYGAEVIVFEKVLSEEEILVVSEYLNGKYNLY